MLKCVLKCVLKDGEPRCGKFSVHLERGTASLGDRCLAFRNDVFDSNIDNKIKYKQSMHNFTVAIENGRYTFRLHK